MDKKDIFFFGFVTKTHGTDGTILIKPELGIDIDYESIESVFIEINGSLVPFFIEDNRSKNNSVVFKLNGIDDINTAKELINNKIYSKILKNIIVENYEFQDLEIIGFNVIDSTYGNIGIVETILQLPQQKIMQIKKGEAEILIPIRNEFVQTIEKENKIIHISAPEGLIEIYLGNNTDTPS